MLVPPILGNDTVFSSICSVFLSDFPRCGHRFSDRILVEDMYGISGFSGQTSTRPRNPGNLTSNKVYVEFVSLTVFNFLGQ